MQRFPVKVAAVGAVKVATGAMAVRRPYWTVCSGLEWFVVVCSGLKWFGVVWSGLEWFVVVCSGL